MAGKDAYFNFINTLNSELTKQKYSYYLYQFLTYCNQSVISKHEKSKKTLSEPLTKEEQGQYNAVQLNKFLKLPEDKIADLIIKYL